MKQTQLGKNIRFLRKMRGISQQKLADYLGLKRNNIASYEASIVEPRAIVFVRLANFFYVTPDELLKADISSDSVLLARILREGVPDNKLREGSSIQRQLEVLEQQTMDMEKVIAGFQEFYRHRRLLSNGNSEAAGFAADFEQLFTMLAELLKTNREILEGQRRG
ncbi:MAG: helix-turn-helix domain-containing protein [Bacteroidota bacterium]